MRPSKYSSCCGLVYEHGKKEKYYKYEFGAGSYMTPEEMESALIHIQHVRWMRPFKAMRHWINSFLHGHNVNDTNFPWNDSTHKLAADMPLAYHDKTQ